MNIPKLLILYVLQMLNDDENILTMRTTLENALRLILRLPSYDAERAIEIILTEDLDGT